MSEALKFKKQLLAKEYGSNVENLVDYLLTIKDKKERTEKALVLKQLIEKMNPSLKYAENGDDKVWGDMYILSEEQLDVDVEYTKPDISAILNKPQKVEYNQRRPRFKHYGKNIELIMNKIKDEKDKEKLDDAIIGIGKLMKSFYQEYNKDGGDTAVIARQISQMSDGKVKVPAEVAENETVFDTVRRPSNRNRNNNHRNNRNNNNRNRNKRR